ncbi:XdhC family protein [Azospirillum picis]|uniref:Xanthine dehydrogenase accessory factor n=1 Tax=Azospirillum picis TaxID=488438 RepID=A0ABU0MLP3_9PROT|nr:XdhC family protein [Azospirillum picis]MBP2300993.1 xanthine dehydrogenase accessory factor [Azospirillum picis]MDQ0534387.1 xanthine dehydrogenase accessory factor [Azospirillum picis]
MKREILDRLLAAKAAAMPVALVTDLNTGLQTLVYEDTAHGGFGLEADLLDEVRRRIRQDRSGLLTDPQDEDGFRLFVHVHNPAMRLLLVGAVHIAQALAPLAVLAGYDVTVIDPRSAFATEARFPGIKLNHAWPDEALAELKPDVRTAVVTLTHDPKLDDPALIAALRSPAFYVGALGSKRTHALRLDRLRDEGLSEAEVQHIRGPVGLSIGAVTPAEIAISIMAQITCVRRGENHPC